MFTVFYQEQHISTYFKVDEAIRLERDGFGRVPQVSCALVGQDGRVFASGNAFLSPTDDFDLVYGMELALARALKKLTQEREVRAKFWKGFHVAVEQTEQDSADLALAWLAWEEPEVSLPRALEIYDQARSEELDTARLASWDIETPTEAPELLTLRAQLRTGEQDHNSPNGKFLDSFEDCSYCDALRSRIAALEEK